MSEGAEDPVIDTMTVSQDIGTYEPKHKKVVLEFHESGAVTWAPVAKENWSKQHPYWEELVGVDPEERYKYASDLR